MCFGLERGRRRHREHSGAWRSAAGAGPLGRSASALDMDASDPQLPFDAIASSRSAVGSL